MKKIPLTRGLFALVDDEDFEWLSASKWRASKNSPNTYYALHDHPGRKTGTQLMHRAILGLTDPKIFTDHINGNGLDNRRSNLRICTKAENTRNARLNSKNTSGFKGVSLRKNLGSWRAQIAFDGKLIYLGDFKTAEEAARAYNEAAIKYHGEFAKLNDV